MWNISKISVNFVMVSVCFCFLSSCSFFFFLSSCLFSYPAPKAKYFSPSAGSSSAASSTGSPVTCSPFAAASCSPFAAASTGSPFACFSSTRRFLASETPAGAPLGGNARFPSFLGGAVFSVSRGTRIWLSAGIAFGARRQVIFKGTCVRALPRVMEPLPDVFFTGGVLHYTAPLSFNRWVHYI